MAAFSKPEVSLFCSGCKGRARRPLRRASPVWLQIFSSVIESDGWAVLVGHRDIRTTARNPIYHSGWGKRGPCYIVNCEGDLDSQGKIISHWSFNEEVQDKMHHNTRGQQLFMLLMLQKKKRKL